jgi:hypothetical protein
MPNPPFNPVDLLRSEFCKFARDALGLPKDTPGCEGVLVLDEAAALGHFGPERFGEYVAELQREGIIERCSFTVDTLVIHSARAQRFIEKQRQRKKLLLTEPMTIKQIATWFNYHRNQVRKNVLDVYWHEKVGAKYRMRTSDMPAAYHVDRMSRGRPAL